MTILIILVAPIAGKTSDRIGSRGLMTAGMVLVAAAALLFSRLGADATFWNLLPAFIIGGVGMALTMTPSAAAATRSVPVDKAGVGSAVLNSARQVGGTMGIAIMGAIVAAEAGGDAIGRRVHGRLRDRAPRRRGDRGRRRGRRLTSSFARTKRRGRTRAAAAADARARRIAADRSRSVRAEGRFTRP